MKRHPRLLQGCLLLTSLAAQAQPSTRHNLDALREQVATAVGAQLPASSRVRVSPLDPQLQLPACPRPEVLLPSGPQPLRGQLRIGVRCHKPQPWTVYLSASIQESRTYYLARTPLQAGHQLQAQDLTTAQAYGEELPPGAVTDEKQWLGRSLTAAVAAGAPLRQQWLRNVNVVTAGQNVKLVLEGPGFRIESEGRALGNAPAGQPVQVRAASGQIVSGKAQAGGWVELDP